MHKSAKPAHVAVGVIDVATRVDAAGKVHM